MAEIGDLQAIERWFCAQGLPSFSRTRRVRPARVMMLIAASVVLAELVLLAPSKEWSWYWDVAAVAGSVAASVVGAVLLRRSKSVSFRGRGRSVGEIAMVLGVGVVLSVVDSVRVGVEVALLNAFLVSLAVLDERFGFWFVLRRAALIAAGELRGVVRHLQRSVPVLVVVLFSLFVTGESWQVAAAAPMGNLVVVTVVLLTFGTVVASTRVRMLVDDVSEDSLLGTPAEGMQLGEPVVMTRLERWNLAGIFGLATACLAAAAAGLFALLLAVLGSLLVPQSVLEAWVGGEIDVIAVGSVVNVTFSVVLLKLTLFMAGIAGLVFCVSLLSDDSFRQSAQQSLESDVRRAGAVRRAYLHACERCA